MADIKDGGPAFPNERYVEMVFGVGNVLRHDRGMSLRDYFAGQALVGLVTFSNGERLRDLFGDDDAAKEPREYFANVAYSLADAMLSAREPKP